ASLDGWAACSRSVVVEGMQRDCHVDVQLCPAGRVRGQLIFAAGSPGGDIYEVTASSDVAAGNGGMANAQRGRFEIGGIALGPCTVRVVRIHIISAGLTERTEVATRQAIATPQGDELLELSIDPPR